MDVKTFDSDTIKVISNLVWLTGEEKNKLYNDFLRISQTYSYNYKTEDFDEEQRELDFQNDCKNILDRLTNFIQREASHFTNKISINSFYKGYIVYPEKLNPRIIAQDGAFIICATEFDDSYTYREVKIDRKEGTKTVFSTHDALNFTPYKKAVIPKKFKKEILQELENLGIHQGSLFPDIEGKSNYIKEKYAQKN